MAQDYITRGGYQVPISDPNEYRRRLVTALIASANQGGPVPGIAGGLARIGQGAIAGWTMNRAEEKAGAERAAKVAAFEEAGKEKDPVAAARKLMAADPDNAYRYGSFLVEALLRQKQDERAKATTDAVMGGGAPAAAAPAAPPAGNSTVVSRETPPPGAQIAMAPPEPPPPVSAAELTARQESGNNPTITNKDTGAYGKYQFLPATGRDVARANPHLGLPEDVRQWTPQQQDQAKAAFDAMNSRQMASMGGGKAPTAAELRLAHYFGAAGASRLLKMDPNTPFEAVPDGALGAPTAEVIRVNPNLRGMRVGDLIGQYRRQFDGAGQEWQPPQGTAAERQRFDAINRRPNEPYSPQTRRFQDEMIGRQFNQAPIGAFDPYEATPLNQAGPPPPPMPQEDMSGVVPPVMQAQAQQPMPMQPTQAAPPQQQAPQQPQIDPGAAFMQAAQQKKAQAQALRSAGNDEAAQATWNEALRLEMQAQQARIQYQQQEVVERRKREEGLQQRQWETITDPNNGKVLGQRNIATGEIKANPLAEKEKPLGQGTVDKLTEAGGKAVDFTRLVSTFNPRFGGKGTETLGSVQNFFGRNFGDDTGQAQWWQDYQSTKNSVRHGLFGGALTPTEKSEFDKANVNPGMAPAQIAANLQRQHKIAMLAAARIATTWIKNGASPDAVEAALGIPLSSLPSPTSGFEDAGKPSGGIGNPVYDTEGNRIR